MKLDTGFGLRMTSSNVFKSIISQESGAEAALSAHYSQKYVIKNFQLISVRLCGGDYIHLLPFNVTYNSKSCL